MLNLTRGALRARTSLTHPLEIATLRLTEETGPIGLTFCPGKQQQDAVTGAWSRDLDLDCDLVRDWGAAAVVSLIEDYEIDMLGVDKLGAAVRGRHMAWYHLPIRDGSVPSANFEKNWVRSGAELQTILRCGFGVLVHCKGGLGRAGLIAARLAAELGMPAASAIAAVRAARPGAIETRIQEAYVLGIGEVAEARPDTSAASIRDRSIGSLLGLAVGDAVGTTLEFKARDTYEPLTDMVGGGPFRLAPGEWTDDTSMALALAETLAGADRLDERALMDRFLAWRDNGAFSHNGRCFDIGMTVSAALRRYNKTNDAIAGSTDPKSAGNGSLMRLAPVAIRFWPDRARLRDVAARQSRTTHGAPEAVDACVAFAELLADAIEGRPGSEVLSPRKLELAGQIPAIMAGSWRGKARAEIRASGYVAHSLEAALWSLGRSGTFEAAVLNAANLGEDADTTAAIAGQLAGALHGASGIPKRWREQLAWREQIVTLAIALMPEGIADAA